MRPFHNAIKGPTAAAPGTSAFTPAAGASQGYRPWSAVPNGWYGLVRYEDGTTWSLEYCFWNGTTLSRGPNQTQFSSTGSLLDLSATATAEMVADGGRVAHRPDQIMRGFVAVPSTATVGVYAMSAATYGGTSVQQGAAVTNSLTQQHRHGRRTAITANATAGFKNTDTVGFSSSTPRLGGWEVCGRFGFLDVPADLKVMIGMMGTFVPDSFAAQPSAWTTDYIMLGKDSTDTNLQLMTRTVYTGVCTKLDTGIAAALNTEYDLTLWQDPGSLAAHILLVRVDTGAIFLGTIPAGPNAPYDGTDYNLGAGVGIAAGGVAAGLTLISLLCRTGG